MYIYCFLVLYARRIYVLLYKVKALRLQFELCHFGEQPVQAAVRTESLAGAIDACGDAVADRCAGAGVSSHRLGHHLATSVQTKRHVSRHLKSTQSRVQRVVYITTITTSCVRTSAFNRRHLVHNKPSLSNQHRLCKNTYSKQRGMKYRCP